jgi:hypothetical protein
MAASPHKSCLEERAWGREGGGGGDAGLAVKKKRTKKT